MVSAKVFVTLPASDHLTWEQHLQATSATVPNLRPETHGSKAKIEDNYLTNLTIHQLLALVPSQSRESRMSAHVLKISICKIVTTTLQSNLFHFYVFVYT